MGEMKTWGSRAIIDATASTEAEPEAFVSHHTNEN
jgi:hypothetical protein